MFRFDPALKVYLHREAVDGRKNINGLALLVEQALGLDPFAPALFVFSNRRRDRIKILLWERTGFWLMIKRLEADRFKWPTDADVVRGTTEGPVLQRGRERRRTGRAGGRRAAMPATTRSTCRHTKRAKRGRKPLDPALPREVVRHELPEGERVCPHDGARCARSAWRPANNWTSSRSRCA
jgi:transposase